MDTRYWGPSGWQLFHLIAFRSPNPGDVLRDMKKVLPCKFCRASTTEFVAAHPLRGDPGKWLFDLHNRVNNKLRTQCKDDPAVVNPGPDPSFDDIKQRYAAMKVSDGVPGRDFLFSIAVNYPDAPEESDKATQETFLRHLALAYPFEELQTVFASYIASNAPDLSSRKAYMKWMYGLLRDLSKKADTSIPSFKGYSQQVAYYKSGCAKKSYKGKTCRRTAGGGLTKNRDHRRTFRVSHRSLL